MSDVKIEDNFEEVQEEIENKVKKSEGNINFEELFSPSFMKKHTNFNSIEEMLNDSPFTIESEEDFDAIPENELNQFVNKNSKFNTWEDMAEKAGQIYMADQLDL
ncbi:MAG: hypothetical protein ACQEQF_10150 [Bacillota bacterium]